jgi:integrase
MAKTVLGKIAEGVDPQDEKIARRQKTMSVNDALTIFEARHLVKNRTGKGVRRALDRDFADEYGKKPLRDITHAQLITVIDQIEDRGAKVQANRMIAHLGKFFRWCIQRNLIENNPAANLSKRVSEKSLARDRSLTDTELVAVWRAVEAYGEPFASFYKLLILTGQRRTEVGELPWSELDIEAKLWTIPKERTKNKKEHLVPLSTQVLDILAAIPKHGPYVFTTTGTRPISGYAKAKLGIDAKLKEADAKVAPWRNHDLRRTLTTAMAGKLGVAPHIADRVLNHTQGTMSDVARVYNTYEYLDERRHALDAWATYVQRLLSPAPGNVVPMRK